MSHLQLTFSPLVIQMPVAAVAAAAAALGAVVMTLEDVVVPLAVAAVEPVGAGIVAVAGIAVAGIAVAVDSVSWLPSLQLAGHSQPLSACMFPQLAAVDSRLGPERTEDVVAFGKVQLQI